MPNRPLRIFVSSPADVDHERMIVKEIVERLAGEYLPYFPLRAILWEEEALTADRTFQAGLTRPADCDIVLVILWTRLGTPLPSEPYQGMTGTEWEFVDAVSAARERGVPEVLVYRKTAPRLVDLADAAAAREAVADRDRLEAFFRRNFFNEDNSFRRAFRVFDSSARFRELLETQLRKLLNRRIGAERRAQAGELQWRGNPFRPWQPFATSDARVFVGREGETRALLEQLERRAQSNRPLLIVCGASGSGKTSLLHAGLLPRLTQAYRFEGIATVRACLLTHAPGVAPLPALAARLCASDCLGESLHGFGLDAPGLSELLRLDPRLAARQLGAALNASAETPEGQARLALLCDPLEALFAAPDADAHALAEYAEAVRALLDGGALWMLCAMRSAAIRHCGRLPALAELLDEDAWFWLEPPPLARLRQIVEIPARIAGIELDTAFTGRDPFEALEAEASQLRFWAPLLQAVLDAGYRAAMGAENAKAPDAAGHARIDPRALGSLAGQALANAERVWSALDAGARGALPMLARALVQFEPDASDTAAVPQPRLGDLATLERDPDCRRLLAALIAARLVVAEGQREPDWSAPGARPPLAAIRSGQQHRSLGRWRAVLDDWLGRLPRGAGVATGVASAPAAPDARWRDYRALVGFAHPALSRDWAPLRDWLRHAEHLTLLARRGQLDRQARLWQRTGGNREYLLGEAGYTTVLTFARAHAAELEPLERAFLAESGAYLALLRRRRRLARGIGLTLVLLLLVTAQAALVARRSSTEARLSLQRVRLKEADLASQGGNTPQAVGRALDAAADLPREAARALGLAFSRNRLLAMASAPSPAPDLPNRPGWGRNGDWLATLVPEQGARLWRLHDGRFTPAREAVLADASLALHTLLKSAGDPDAQPPWLGWIGIGTAGIWRLPAAPGAPPDVACGAPAGGVLALDPTQRLLALATSGSDGNQGLCLVDLAHPELTPWRHPFDELELRGLSFAPDGHALLTASARGRTHLIALEAGATGPSGAIRLSLPADGPLGRPFNRAVFDHAGERIAIAAVDERARLYRRDGTPLAELNRAEIDGRSFPLHGSAVRDLAFAPRGDFLVTVDDEGQVVRWALDGSGQAVVLGKHALSIVSLALARQPESVGNGGETLVLTASLDRTARLWGLETGRELAVFGHDAALSGARFAADGQRVVTHSARDGSVRLWSVAPVSRLALAAHHPEPTNHVWHLDLAQAPPELAVDGPALLLATAGFDGEARVWRYPRARANAALELLRGLPQGEGPAAIRPVRRVRFAPSGQLLASARFDGSARLDNLLTGQGCRMSAAAPGTGRVWQVLFDPRGRWLLTTSDDPTDPVRLFALDDCQPLEGGAALRHGQAAVEAASVRALGEETLVATGDAAGVLRLLRVSADGAWRQHCALDLGIGSLAEVAIAPDGLLLGAAGEAPQGALVPVTAAGCGPVRRLNGHGGRLYSIAFAPDGRRALTASLDKTARLWSREGTPLAVLRGHQDRVYSAVFDPRGDWILTAARDGTLRLWHMPRQFSGGVAELRALLPLPASLGGAAFADFSPDGHYLAGAYWDNAALLWRLWHDGEDPPATLVQQWGPKLARLVLVQEAYAFRRDHRAMETPLDLGEE